MKKLTSYHLKWIALVTMTIDHIGYFLFPRYKILRIIGRIAFPLYAFLCAESYRYTRSRETYLLRLLVFGGLMEIVLQMVEPGSSANIFLTLASGFALLWCMEGKQPLCLAIAILGLILKVDYGWYGIVLVPLMYYCKDRLWILLGVLPVLTHAYIETSWCADTQYYSVMAVCILMLYNGKKGYSSKFMKWFFYAYYPVHVAILASISMF